MTVALDAEREGFECQKDAEVPATQLEVRRLLPDAGSDLLEPGSPGAGGCTNPRDIGAIEIADRFHLVEVAEGAADDVVTALRASTIKGKKATIRCAHEGR